MSKLTEAQQILEAFGLPIPQQNERSALILLALCNLTESDKWQDAKQVSMAIVGNKKKPEYPGMMRFIAKHYKKKNPYAENSRETFRRQTIHPFLHAGIVVQNPEDLSLATNSKRNHYRLTDPALRVIRAFGSKRWSSEVKSFLSTIGSLQQKYSKVRDLQKIPVKLADGKELKFSPGKHNEVQKAIIEKFAPTFAPGSQLLYVGDTANKDLYIDVTSLDVLGIPISEHSKLPDVVLFDAQRNWLFLIEAVTSHGPVSNKRMDEFAALLGECKASKVYVSAFPDFQEFRKHTSNIAWETEVWIVDSPEHMIHFNGDRFLGPH